MDNPALLIPAIVFLCLIAPLVVTTCILDNKKLMIGKTICKGCASLCFVVAGILFYLNGSRENWQLMVLLGLVLGMFGDIFLSEFAKGKTCDLFNAAGMLCFIAGHVLFITAFITASFEFDYLVLLTVGVTLALTCLGAGTRFLSAEKPPMMIGAFIYAIVVSLMLAAALNLVLNSAVKFGWLIVTGSALFFISDVILGIINYNNKFKEKRRFLLPAVLVCYYLGQAMIAFSLIS